MSLIIMKLKIDGHPTSITHFHDKICIFIIILAYYLGVLVKIRKWKKVATGYLNSFKGIRDMTVKTRR